MTAQPSTLALARQIEERLNLKDSQLVQQLTAVSQTLEQARQYAGLPDASGHRYIWHDALVHFSAFTSPTDTTSSL